MLQPIGPYTFLEEEIKRMDKRKQLGPQHLDYWVKVLRVKTIISDQDQIWWQPFLITYMTGAAFKNVM